MAKLLLSVLTVVAVIQSTPDTAITADWTVLSNINALELLREPSSGFKIEITEEAIQKTPAWRDENDNPPISVRRAIRLADGLRDKLVKDTTEWRWRLETASLVPWWPDLPSGRWFWEIRYHAYNEGGYTGPSNDLNLVVLMDGSVIQPVRHKRTDDAAPRGGGARQAPLASQKGKDG